MIDTHTHIFAEEFDSDIDEVITRAKNVGVEHLILPNEDENSLQRLSALCQKYSNFCSPLYGLHPTEVRDNYREQLNLIFDFAEKQPNMCGVGEIGLDLYWDKSNTIRQKEAFAWQIDYAIQKQFPMSIHCREAYLELFEVLSHFDSNKIKGSVHCFSGTTSDAMKIIDEYPNLMLGINGTITYKKSVLPEIFRAIPISRILLETDAPYLSPVPNRGQRNEPSNLIYIIKFLATILGTTEIEIEQMTNQNATHIFSFLQRKNEIFS